MKKAIVFAYSSVGAECMKVLLNHPDIDIKLIYTHEDDPHEERWFASVRDMAVKNGIDVLTCEPDYDTVKRIKPDVIFSFYYRKIIDMKILSLAPLGAYNMHGSLLPKYRGRACVNWAVLNGETETGVTLHRMTEYADRGNIIAQEAVPIGENDTAIDVFKKIIPASGRVGRGLLFLVCCVAGRRAFGPVLEAVVPMGNSILRGTLRSWGLDI